MLFAAAIILITNFNVGLGEIVLQSPRVTNWGRWGEWENCPQGQYVTAFKLRTEYRRTQGDNTALNAIKLFCSLPGENIVYTNGISSSEQKWGEWGSEFRCKNGIFTAFQLRSEEDQGTSDDTAANNLRMFCSNSDPKAIEGDGYTWGNWTAEQRCEKKQGICGLRTQIEVDQGSGDDTALNNVDMRCCDIASTEIPCPPNSLEEKGKTCTNKDIVLQSPRVTNWGRWGEWENCPQGQYVTAFKLRTEYRRTQGDNTALNAIKLFCSLPGENIVYTNGISSSEQKWGEWGSEFRCKNGIFTAFQLRSEEDQGTSDDTAANNLRMFCSNSDPKAIEGDGYTWGNWTAEQSCEKKQGICGLRTQIEVDQGSGDDTALNNVDMRCCHFAIPEITCPPKDFWDKVMTCTNKDIVLKSPRVTEWGNWGEWDYCPQGQYVTGFRLKTEARQGDGDDSALNAIKLYCSLPGEIGSYMKGISSAEQRWGDWGNEYICRNGILTGFQLRSEVNQGSGDDTAANNLRMFCSNPDTKVLEGDGQIWGNWTAEQSCEKKQGICGLQTQIEPERGSEDDSALNNVDMRCCGILSPATTCSPKDSWEKVVSCNNKDFSGSLACAFEYTRGVSTPFSSSSSEWSVLQSVGLSLGSEMLSIKISFETKLSFSRSTSHSWISEQSSTWTEGKKLTSKFQVAPGFRADLVQVVGVCSEFMVYTMDFSLHLYDFNGNLQSRRAISPQQVEAGNF